MIEPAGEITLRSAVAEDELFLRQLYRSTREEELAIFGWTTEQENIFVDVQYRAQSYSFSQAHPDGRQQIVLLSGEPIGRLFTSDIESTILLVDISLLTQYRNGGIGSHLMNGLLTRARDENKQVRLQVRKANRACLWYERLGFRVIQDTGMYYEMVWQP